MYSFTDKTIATALIRKKEENRNFEVKVLLDKQQAQSRSSQIKYLTKNGIKVKVCESEIEHAKVIIIDNKIVFTGSYNLTDNAKTKNDETLNELKSKEVVMRYIGYFKKRWEQQDNTKVLDNFLNMNKQTNKGIK